MVRQIKSDTPTRGVIEYKADYGDGSPIETHREVIGPYDLERICKMMTKEALWQMPRGTEVIEVRYERVKEWEITGYEFQVP